MCSGIQASTSGCDARSRRSTCGCRVGRCGNESGRVLGLLVERVWGGGGGRAICVFAGDEYKWDEVGEAALWSLVEKYKKELYDQKNGFTRNEYLDKIA